LFTITAHTADRPPAVVANGPAGTRVVITAMRGEFEGPRLKGTIADAAGGDWVLARADGSLKLDVRLVLQTEDGATIYMTYAGVGRREADGGVSVRTAPLFEVGDERYAWLNNVQAVGIGSSTPTSVTYEIYALA
jgi:hypothetical protein